MIFIGSFQLIPSASLAPKKPIGRSVAPWQPGKPPSLGSGARFEARLRGPGMPPKSGRVRVCVCLCLCLCLCVVCVVCVGGCLFQAAGSAFSVKGRGKTQMHLGGRLVPDKPERKQQKQTNKIPWESSAQRIRKQVSMGN